MGRTTDMSQADALFKEFYGSGKDQSLINAKTPLMSILMKNKKADWVGDNFVQPVRFGSAVGIGYRAEGQVLPTPVASPRGKAVFPAKPGYATAEFSRQAIRASRSDKGAFAKVTVDEVAATIEGYQLHMVERALFGDGSGKLGEVASVTGAGTALSPWVMTMTTTGTNAPKHKKRYYPRNAKLDLYSSAGVYGMTVQVVSASSTTVTAITLVTGSAITPVALDIAYWQGNKDQEILGLRSFAPVAAGTLYGIDQSANPEFRGAIKTVSGAISYDILNSTVSELEEEIDSPKLGVTSHKAMSIIKSQSEDNKRYDMVEVKSSDAKIGFKGVQVMSDEGAFPLLSSQFCPDDEIWLLDPKYIQIVMREDFGWFDDDGTILMRDPNRDILASRYGGYSEVFCSKPNTIAVIRGFTVP